MLLMMCEFDWEVLGVVTSVVGFIVLVAVGIPLLMSWFDGDICWHKWSHWQLVHRSEFHATMERTCSKCGVIQITIRGGGN